MYIDCLVAVCVLVFALYGCWRGLLRKLASLGSLVIATLAAGYVGSGLAAYAADRWRVSSPMVSIVCILVGWVMLFVLCRILLGLAAKALGSSPEGKPKPWNRLLGALFGAAEALLLCWFVVGALDAVPEDIRVARLPRLHEQMKRSGFATFTHGTSPLAWLELRPLIADVAAIADNPQALRSLAEDPTVRRLVEHPKVREVLRDEKLVEEVKRGRVFRFLSDRRVADALEDAEVRQLLRSSSLREVVRRTADEARKAKAEAR